jgi:hypothetical protein
MYFYLDGCNDGGFQRDRGHLPREVRRHQPHPEQRQVLDRGRLSRRRRIHRTPWKLPHRPGHCKLGKQLKVIHA